MKKTYMLLGALAAFGSVNAAQYGYSDGQDAGQPYSQGQTFYQAQPYSQGQTYYYDQGSPAYYNENRSLQNYSNPTPMPSGYDQGNRTWMNDASRNIDPSNTQWRSNPELTPMPSSYDQGNRSWVIDANRNIDPSNTQWRSNPELTPMPSGYDQGNRIWINDANRNIDPSNPQWSSNPALTPMPSGYDQGNRSWINDTNNPSWLNNRNTTPSGFSNDSYLRQSSDTYYSPDTRRDQYSNDNQYNTPSYDQNYQYNRSSDNQYARPQGNDQYATEEDRQLGQKIRDALRGGWFSQGYDGIILIIRDRNVTLRGSIENPSDKQKLEDKVRNVQGVRSVNSQLALKSRETSDAYSGSPTYNSNYSNENSYNTRDAQDGSANDQFLTDEDRRLGKKIRDDLKGGWFSRGYENVSFNIKNGNVILMGFVESASDRTKVEDKIRNISGVKSVMNQLSVRGSTRTGSRY